ncbi:MAG: sulfotransferase [Alphaproteobacteria bacterium]|nr:sulfotransferase [Alphaproteobacteria bacterium]
MNQQTLPKPRLAQAVETVVAALNNSDQTGAIRLARAALDEGLIHPLFLNLRAFWLEGRGRLNDAVADLERAHALAPDDVPVLNALGLALAKQFRPVEATKAFETVIALQPDFTPAYFNHGSACEMWGEIDRAQQSYHEAIARSAGRRDSAEPLSRLAFLAARRGDAGEARAFAQRAVELMPNHPVARLALARADILDGNLEAADQRIRELLASSVLSGYDRYHATGALGDLRHREGRFADAFAAYEGGNSEWSRVATAKHNYGRATSASGLGTLEWMYRAYANHPALPKPSRTAASGNSRHVFLIGFIRSGTTLLEQVLASHPDVVTMEEKEALADSATAFLSDEHGLERMRALSEDERAFYVQKYWESAKEQGFDPAGAIFVDKQPFNVVKLPLIAALFPDAKILFAVRDPRDVLLSCFRQRFHLNTFTFELLTVGGAARFYDAYMTLAERFRQVLPLDLLQVRHEDLVDDFEGEVSKVCDFLGIAWTDAMRDFAERRKVRAIATPSAAQIAKGLNREGVGQWRNYAEPLAPALPVLAPWVKRFGYQD